MTNQDHSQEIKGIYKYYREEFKAWLAAVEARRQSFPPEILNEIRMAFDHIARCFADGLPEDKIKRNIERANNHISRAIFDCVKNLILSYNDEIEDFERATKRIDLSLIAGGRFFVEYRELKQKATESVRHAKEIEKNDTVESYKQDSFNLFTQSLSFYKDLSDLISKYIHEVNWAKFKTAKGNLVKVIWFLAGAFISAILSSLFAAQEIKGVITRILKLFGIQIS